jgi:hypothetical protein
MCKVKGEERSGPLTRTRTGTMCTHPACLDLTMIEPKRNEAQPCKSVTCGVDWVREPKPKICHILVKTRACFEKAVKSILLLSANEFVAL